MPEVPTFNRQVGTAPTPDASLSTRIPRSSLGQALMQAGAHVGQIAKREIEENDRAMITRAETELIEWENSALLDPETGAFTRKGEDAFDLDEQVIPEFEKAVQGIADGLTTDRQRQIFGELAERRSTSVSRKLLEHETIQRDSFYDDQTEAAVDSSVRAAGNFYNDPERISEELARQKRVISDQARRHGWSEEEKNNHINNFRSKTHLEVIERMIAINESSKARDYFEGVREQLLGDDATAVEKALATNDVQLRAQITAQLRDIEAAAKQGIPIGEIPPEPMLQAVFGEFEGSQAYNRAKAYAELSTTIRGLHDSPGAELLETLLGQAPTQVKGAADQTQRAAVVSSAVQSIFSQREKDPAAYMISHNGVVAKAFSTLEENPDAYVEILEAERERLQINDDSILPKAYENEIVTRIANPDSNESLYTTVTSEASRWGKHWPRVLGQIQGKLPSTASVIASGVSPATGIALASTANLKPTELEALLPRNATRPEVEAHVRGDFEEFLRTFPPDAGGVRTREAIFDSAVRLTLFHHGAGNGYSEARTLAFSQLVEDMYHIEEIGGVPFRIPTNHNPNLVADGAERFINEYEAKSSLGFDTLGTNLADEEMQGVVTQYLRENAYWVTKPDGSGVRMYVDGAPVVDAEELVELDWTDLEDAERQLQVDKKKAVSRDILSKDIGGP